MSACNCCSEPPCAAPVLECVSVSAECYSPACGEVDPDQDPPVDLDADPPVLAKYCKTVTTHHGDGEGDTIKTYSVDGEGNCTSTCSGSWTHKDSGTKFNGTIPDGFGGTSTINCSQWGSSTTYTYSDGSCSAEAVTDPTAHSFAHNTTSTVGESGTYDCIDGVGTQTITAGGVTTSYPVDETICPCVGDSATLTPDTKDYSDCEEVPPCDLPEFPEFPSWPTTPPDDPVEFEDGQGSGCVAIRNWTVGGVSKNETKVQWRIRHSPTGTCYLKVWLRKTTTVTGDPTADPPVEDEVTTDDSETYEWEGTGNPCIDNPDDGASATSNDIIDEDDHAIDPPDENGSISIEILKYSCLRGYEPDVSDEDNPQPNGYPDPAWEAAAP